MRQFINIPEEHRKRACSSCNTYPCCYFSLSAFPRTSSSSFSTQQAAKKALLNATAKAKINCFFPACLSSSEHVHKLHRLRRQKENYINDFLGILFWDLRCFVSYQIQLEPPSVSLPLHPQTQQLSGWTSSEEKHTVPLETKMVLGTMIVLLYGIKHICRGC